MSSMPSIDYESRADRRDHQALRLWLRFFACANLVEGCVRRNLRSQFGTTLPRFDLMAQLERNPAGLKMGEISRRMMVTGGNVTAITDELEAAGLVTRRSARGDRRAFSVRLTPAGRRTFAAMAKAHERWIIDLFSGLSGKDRAGMLEALAKLKRHIASRDGEVHA
jgi:DNA-binding MarR family transcriptional regulator